MQTVTVEKTISADAASVWSLLANFGDVGWIPVAQQVRTEGEGPGMRRFIYGSGEQPVVERLLGLDEETRTLTYAIEQGNPLPVSSYAAEAVVRGDAAQAHVTWTVSYEPAGPDDAVRAGTDAIYSAMADWLKDAATP